MSDKVYVLMMERQTPPFTGSYFLGVFAEEELAIAAARYETEHMKGKYTGKIISTKLNQMVETKLDAATLHRLLTK